MLVQALRGSEVLEKLNLWGTWWAGHMGHVGVRVCGVGDVVLAGMCV